MGSQRVRHDLATEQEQHWRNGARGTFHQEVCTWRHSPWKAILQYSSKLKICLSIILGNYPINSDMPKTCTRLFVAGSFIAEVGHWQPVAKFGQLCGFVNKVLLSHSHIHSFIHYPWLLLSCKGQSWAVGTETAWPTNPEIFTLWSLTKSIDPWFIWKAQNNLIPW